MRHWWTVGGRVILELGKSTLLLINLFFLEGVVEGEWGFIENTYFRS